MAIKYNIGTYEDALGKRLVVGDIVSANPKNKKQHGLKLNARYVVLWLGNDDAEIEGLSKVVKGKKYSLGRYNLIRRSKR